MTERAIARKLAAESLKQGEPLKWFECLYSQADGDSSVIPWADMTVNPNLAAWLERRQLDGTGRTALVVGCGLGDDAQTLAALNFKVTAFDVSETCINWCRSRFPESPVDYRVADLFDSPAEWHQAFDFVFEAYTLQVLPGELRNQAMIRIAEFVAPGGTLLLVTRGREPADPPGQMPWPVVRAELDAVQSCGLTEVNCEDYIENEDPPVRRFRVEYWRPREPGETGE